MKRPILCLVILSLLFCFPGCKNNKNADGTYPLIREGNTIGISLPDENWLATASTLTTLLENVGYQTTLQYAQNDPKTQAEQIKQMADQGVNCIVVAAVDNLTLAEAIDYAAAKEVKIIAYDRLPSDTENINYYVAPDYHAMGVAVAEVITAGLDEEEIYTFELFMGEPANPSSYLYWEGLLTVLQPYITNGTLQNLSGRLEFEDVCIPDGTAETAQEACITRLDYHYGDTTVDICITGTNTITKGVIAALEAKGYTQQNWPAIAGCEQADNPLSMGNISVTAYTNPEELTKGCLAMVDAAISGNQPNVGKELTATDNGAASVATYLCDYELAERQ